MIFIQIAAYRDPELVPTIQDCLANAKWPDDLRFGICWQDDPSSFNVAAPAASPRPLRAFPSAAARCIHNSSFSSDPRFRIDRVPWQESRGLCWARSRIQRLYQGEDYTLQLDSHHRFAPHWDEALLSMLEQTGSRKPIITSYAGMYDPGVDGGKKLNSDPFKMVAEKFTPSGTILFRPHSIEGWEDLHRPVPARFVSGHFFFTIGKHCEEYKYDPNLYFAGDEISLSIRSYTLGYDLFHPHRCLIWHEYTRAGRVKIWQDDPKWHEKDAISKRRLRALLRETEEPQISQSAQMQRAGSHPVTHSPTHPVILTGYDLGTVRSHRDYEIYAGIDFARRELSPCTLRGDDPPTSPCHLVTPSPCHPHWFSSAHCRSAAHCTACRHDESFRESLLAAGQVSERDFPCPFGMSPPSPHEGPGTRLMRLLRRLGFRHSDRCGCQDMALKMNLGGPQWCRENIDQILNVMRKAAAAPSSNPLRLPFIECAARRMVLHCAKS